MDDIAATPQAVEGIMPIIDRAILTAHLLTGSLQEAERAALKAIDSWNPDEEPGDVVFNNVLEAAARAQLQPNTSYSDASGSHLPNELKKVLGLKPWLRRCFVLRILLGLPSQACARLLFLDSQQVDEYTCAAVQSLAAF
jgi:hypothetical protein